MQTVVNHTGFTRDEFERYYAANSGVSVDELRSMGLVVVPCHGCDYDHCKGWSVFTRDGLNSPIICKMERLTDDEVREALSRLDSVLPPD